MWNRAENQVKIVLIRHGSTLSNKERRYLGKTDECLSDEGIRVLRNLKKQNRYPKVDIVFASPMKRCLETAKILYPECEVIKVPQWEEMDFGDFEGKNYLELAKNKQYQEWIDSGGTLPFPNGESREAFCKRCREGLYKMLEQFSNVQQEMPDTVPAIGMIVHGGTIMALLSFLCGGEYFEYQVSNGNGYVGVMRVREDCYEMTGLEKLAGE